MVFFRDFSLHLFMLKAVVYVVPNIPLDLKGVRGIIWNKTRRISLNIQKTKIKSRGTEISS